MNCLLWKQVRVLDWRRWWRVGARRKRARSSPSCRWTGARWWCAIGALLHFDLSLLCRQVLLLVLVISARAPVQAVRAHGDAAEGLGRHGGHRAEGRAHHAHREGLERRAQRHPHRPRAHRGQRAERGRAQGTPTPTCPCRCPNALARYWSNFRCIFVCISHMLLGKRNLFRFGKTLSTFCRNCLSIFIASRNFDTFDNENRARFYPICDVHCTVLYSYTLCPYYVRVHAYSYGWEWHLDYYLNMTLYCEKASSASQLAFTEFLSL